MGITSLQKDFRLAKGEGCSKCKMTGYLGRTGIFEWLTISKELREFILQLSSQENIKKVSLNTEGKSLREDGLAKALQRITTLEEILDVTQEE